MPTLLVASPRLSYASHGSLSLQDVLAMLSAGPMSLPELQACCGRAEAAYKVNHGGGASQTLTLNDR